MFLLIVLLILFLLQIPVNTARTKKRRIMAGLSDEESDIQFYEDLPDTGDTILLLPGRKFPLDFPGGQFNIHGQPMILTEIANSGLGTGLNIWDGSIILAKFLESKFRTLEGIRVMEVGSGVGLVGLSAAYLGADVLLTDLDYALQHTKTVIEKNRPYIKGKAATAELDWFHPESSNATEWLDQGPIHLIVGADVVWVEELIPPLVKTLKMLLTKANEQSQEYNVSTNGATSSNLPPSLSKPAVLISHQTRSNASDALMLSLFKNEGLTVEVVPPQEHHPEYRDSDIHILKVTL